MLLRIWLKFVGTQKNVFKISNMKLIFEYGCRLALSLATAWNVMGSTFFAIIATFRSSAPSIGCAAAASEKTISPIAKPPQKGRLQGIEGRSENRRTAPSRRGRVV